MNSTRRSEKDLAVTAAATLARAVVTLLVMRATTELVAPIKRDHTRDSNARRPESFVPSHGRFHRASCTGRNACRYRTTEGAMVAPWDKVTKFCSSYPEALAPIITRVTKLMPRVSYHSRVDAGQGPAHDMTAVKNTRPPWGGDSVSTPDVEGEQYSKSCCKVRLTFMYLDHSFAVTPTSQHVLSASRSAPLPPGDKKRVNHTVTECS